ncbi:MAG TPA: DMT family transporter, partial [Rhizobiales bacterium]|nr:DMT family transporter [Hyphomicrobiales bacterium]
GSLYMTLAMAGYVVNDSLIKLVGNDLPLGMILVVRGSFAIVLIMVLALAIGALKHWRMMFSSPVLKRATFDTLATFLFLTGLFHMSIAIATAILQMVPLMVMLFGALFLKERIGWRRIMAILVGFAGVLLVVQPGTSGFNNYAILLFGVVILVAVRDTTTRNMPDSVPSLLITLTNVVMVTIAGSFYALYQGVEPVNPQQFLILSTSSVFLVAATMFIILTMRTAAISITAPFRYSAILWSLISAYMVFNEVPNGLAIIGITMITGAGLYSLFRSQTPTR